MSFLGRIDTRLQELGITLPEPLRLPPGTALPFPWVQVCGDRAFISGHGPVKPDGELGRPLGKVGAEVSVEEAVALARKTGLAIHARSAVGLAELSMRIAVEIEAEVLIRP